MNLRVKQFVFVALPVLITLAFIASLWYGINQIYT